MQKLLSKMFLERQRFNALPFLLLTIFCCCAAFQGALAMTPTDKSESWPDAWGVLNHYDKNGISDIQNADYFIAKDGQKNPKAEYDAFIGILREYMADGSHTEILCQFPARVTFATHTLDWFHKKDRPYCKDYISEVNPEKIESLSLMFASGYFDNPSSYYGHTLLKFNYDGSVLNQRTLNSSLNYGADSGNEDGTLMYVLNGLFGGYQATYQRNNNFINSHRYTNAQLRDIWEYKLNLTAEQVKFIAEHAWELKRAKFTYYFFNDNCAHRIADLIERATSSKLAYSHGFWVLPLQVIEHAKMVKGSAGDLISSEVYHPSLKRTFSKRYEALSSDEKRDFINFFKASDIERTKLVTTFTENVLLLILEQLDIRIAKSTIEKTKNKEDAVFQEQRRIILAELFRRTSGYKMAPLDWGKNNTLLNYKPISVVRAGVSRRDDNDHFSLQYQIANNDLLDSPIPGQERSKVIMGGFQLDMSDDAFQIRDVTLIDILNLNTNPLPFWLTDEYSWQLRVAYDHQNSICKSCGSFGVTGKAGQSIRFNDDWMAYGLAGMTLRHRQVDDFGFLSFVGDSAVIYSADPSHAVQFGFNVIYDPLHGESDGNLDAEFSYKFNDNKDIRFSYERSLENESFLSVRVGYYFN
jgi:hypothetical protein